MEPVSDPPDTLDRGEDAPPDIDGRARRRDVSVAAAFISMSPSVVCVSVSIRLSTSLAFPFSFTLDLASFLPLAWPCAPSAVRGDFGGFFNGVDGFPFSGAGTGGSSGLWMVRTRFVGGGARIDVNRLWAADAVVGGGAIGPLREACLLDEVGFVELPCIAGLA